MPEGSLGRRKPMPSLRKILILTIGLVVPILVAGALLAVWSFQRAALEGRHRIDAAVEIELSALSDSLSRINSYLIRTLQSNVDVRGIMDAQTDHTRYVAARSLWSELDYQRNALARDFSLLFFYPEQNITVACYDSPNDYARNEAIAQEIKRQAALGAYRVNRRGWTHMRLEGDDYFVQVFSEDGGYVGCWAPCGRLLSFLNPALLQGDGFFLVLDGLDTETDQARMEEKGIRAEGEQFLWGTRGGYCAVFDIKTTESRVVVCANPAVDWIGLMLLGGFVCFVLLITLAFSGFTLFYFRHYIERPLARFRAQVYRYVQERQVIRRHGFAELNQAVDSADELTALIEQLRIDAYEEKLQLAKTELEYFQLQIKPHFFVNCFSILHGMAQKQDYQRIQVFCIKLSNYVRYLFTDGFHMVSVGEELSMVREYLDIQSIRYRTRTQVGGHVEDQVLGCALPPLTLLTFVENAVKHAGDPGTLRIAVDASLEPDDGGFLRLVVRDNGPGFQQGQLALLNAPALEESEGAKPGHMGIRNVRKRLALLYGDQFSLRFANLPGGCQVELMIPCRASAAASGTITPDRYQTQT